MRSPVSFIGSTAVDPLVGCSREDVTWHPKVEAPAEPDEQGAVLAAAGAVDPVVAPAVDAVLVVVGDRVTEDAAVSGAGTVAAVVSAVSGATGASVAVTADGEPVAVVVRAVRHARGTARSAAVPVGRVTGSRRADWSPRGRGCPNRASPTRSPARNWTAGSTSSCGPSPRRTPREWPVTW